MKRNQGFTLVELLVVIGIIALLISILLPSLNRVRWQAKTTACAARMRDVVLAVQMYANDNKGALPPFPGDKGDQPGQPPFNINSFTSQFNGAFQEAFSSTTVFAKTDDGANLGRLWRTNYLKTQKTFYCPSSPDIYPIPDPNVRNFTNYILNPHIKYIDSAATIAQFWWKKLPNYGVVKNATMMYVDQKTYTPALKTVPIFRRAILTDPLYGAAPDDKRYITHSIGNRRAFNFAYPDGSVQTYTDNQWAGRVIDRWVRFLDLSNSLQHAADGGNVNFTSNWQNDLYNAIPVQPG